jgi:glycosyltransferase involved in cell wall biosynthesis
LKVLIVSYYWPPSGGSGVQRWLYFSRHLKNLGIQTEVVTIDPEEAAYSVIDHSLTQLVNDISTHKTKGGFQLLKLYSFLKSGNSKSNIPVGNLGNEKKSTFDAIASQIRANLFIPDARVGWNKQALPIAKDLVSKNKFDYIITTGPPHSTHLIGLEIQKEFGIKWLADFRDPWREVYYNTLFKKTKWADKKDQKLETEVLQKADIVLTVGPSMAELLQNKLSANNDKVKFILNGFDETKFTAIKGKRYPEFTIAHIGLWSLNQAHSEIVQALKSILSENNSVKIRFILVGNVASEIIQELEQIPHLIVDIKGKVSHEEALTEMLNADLLLNCLAILPNSKLLISGKLMEYLASGNHTIVIGPTGGDAAKIMKNVENAFIFVPNDVSNLTSKIKELYNLPRKEIQLNSTINNYSRENTAKELYELLKTNM